MPPLLSDLGPQIDEAIWRPAVTEHPAGYLFVFRPPDIDALPALKIHDSTVIYTAQNSKWLKQNECFVTSGVSFEQMMARNWSLYSSTKI